MKSEMEDPQSPLLGLTKDQVAEHNTKGDAWIIIHGKVYDVSAFFDNHPGGGNVLLDSAGADATEDFDFVGHSEDALKSLASFEVGMILTNAAPKTKLVRDRLASDRKLSAGRTAKVSSQLAKRMVPLAILFSVVAVLGTWSLASLKRTYIQQAETRNSGHIDPWIGITAGLLIIMLSGAVAFRVARDYLFSYKGVFEYQPYFTYR